MFTSPDKLQCPAKNSIAIDVGETMLVERKKMPTEL